MSLDDPLPEHEQAVSAPRDGRPAPRVLGVAELLLAASDALQVRLGAVSVWPTTFQPVCFRRTPRLIRQSDPEGLHLSLPLSGALRTVRGEREDVYAPGSLCVVDTSRPVDVHGGEGTSPHTGVGIELPKTLLPLPRHRLDEVAGLRFSTREGFGALLAGLITLAFYNDIHRLVS